LENRRAAASEPGGLSRAKDETSKVLKSADVPFVFIYEAGGRAQSGIFRAGKRTRQ
jgi:hypothetical protein